MRDCLKVYRISSFDMEDVEMGIIIRTIKGFSDCMVPALDRENNHSWWDGLVAAACLPEPCGVYAIVSQELTLDRVDNVVAVGCLLPDQHGAGIAYGMDGPWLALGHVFRPYRGHGLHHDLVNTRLDVLVSYGVRKANVSVSRDNTRSLVTVIKAGFRPVAVGPDRDPDGEGAPTVYLHWDAEWSKAG